MKHRMTDLTPPELTALLIQVIIVLVIVGRSYRMTKGVRYTPLRLLLLPALLLILWGATEAESITLTPWALPYLIALDSGILVVSFLAFTGVAERRTQVEIGPDGGTTYRIGISLAVLFVGAYLIRLGLALEYFPASLVFGSVSGGFPPAWQQTVLGVIDGLFSMSVGLLLGRSRGISQKVRSLRKQPP